MNVTGLISRAETILRSNSPTILTALGASGTITTAYLAGKASFKAAKRINNEERFSQGKLVKEPLAKKEAFKLVWKFYIPTVISGATTIGCIVFARKIDSRRTAALTAAYSLSERAFIEYKDKVVETLGERKEQKVRDDIAQDKVRANPPSSTLILEGAGGVLVCELFTGRYFKSDMESLKKAENELNGYLLRHTYATLSDFYHIIGLKNTTESSNIGWNADKLMELEFSHALAEGVPCITFEYNYTKPL